MNSLSTEVWRMIDMLVILLQEKKLRRAQESDEPMDHRSCIRCII